LRIRVPGERDAHCYRSESDGHRGGVSDRNDGHFRCRRFHFDSSPRRLTAKHLPRLPLGEETGSSITAPERNAAAQR